MLPRKSCQIIRKGRRMARRFVYINLIFAGILFGVLALVAALAAAATQSGYAGVCYGFTDGSWPCSRAEYFSAQWFWALMIAMIPFAGLTAIWGGYAAGALAWFRVGRARLAATIGAALAGVAVGAALGVGITLALMSLAEVSAMR